MSISSKLTHCPEVELVSFYSGWYGEFPLTSKLVIGLKALISIGNHSHIDFLGGTLSSEINMATSFWVELIKIKGKHLTGKVVKTNFLFNAGSIFHFNSNDICQIKGSFEWNINNLSVLVSKNIVLKKEQVGYFFSYKMEPWSIGKIFYARSEINKSKVGIPLVEIPILELLAYDPLIKPYLETNALNGYVRVNDTVFQELNLDVRDERIFPLSYCGPNIIIDDYEDDPDFLF